MIKINLLAEKKQLKTRTPAAALESPGGGGQTLVLAGILIAFVAIAGILWYMTNAELAEWERKHEAADQELARLAEIRKKGDQYKKQKALLTRKIDLITALKKQQEVPVHILDQVSKNLPSALWLESLDANNNSISISGKATNYNAVSNFYNNLSSAGYFADVTLGRTFEANEGVAFSIKCSFVVPGSEQPAANEQG